MTDEYIHTYVSLSGDARSRQRLYTEILSQAKTREEILGSSAWTIAVIRRRLNNTQVKMNKANTEADD